MFSAIDHTFLQLQIHFVFYGIVTQAQTLWAAQPYYLPNQTLKLHLCFILDQFD